MHQVRYIPQYGEAAPDFKVGIWGFMSYFQNVATEYMCLRGVGNNDLFEKYGLIWMFTRYKLKIHREALLQHPVKMQSWGEAGEKSSRFWQNFRIIQRGRVCAEGRLENCLYDVVNHCVCHEPPFSLPVEPGPEDAESIGPYSLLPRQLENGEKCYTHVVRYSDIDASRHMNNRIYVRLLMDAFDSRFHAAHDITEFEIQYFNQCFEGEAVDIIKQQQGEEMFLLVRKENGETAAASRFQFMQKE